MPDPVPPMSLRIGRARNNAGERCAGGGGAPQLKQDSDAENFWNRRQIDARTDCRLQGGWISVEPVGGVLCPERLISSRHNMPCQDSDAENFRRLHL